jgi:hypothetical protein
MEEEKKMKRMMFLLAALAMSSFILLAACKKETKVEPAADETKTEEPKADEPKADEPKADEPKADEPKAEGGDSVGVPECDEYIGKYTKCVADKIPAAQKALMEKSLTAMKDAWKKAAETEAGKKGLAVACKTALDTAKKSMAAFKCDF